MDIAGTGISGTKTVRVLPGFRPDTNLAYKWHEVSKRNWKATDRGSGQDVYQADIEVYGKEAVITELIDAIQDNRAADSHVLTLSNFFSSEYIFGSDVDHSGSITATVLKFPERRQGSFKGWGVALKLRALSPSFTGSATFPTLNGLDFGVIAKRDWNMSKYDDYEGNFTYLDKQHDSGIFEGVFTLTEANMQNLRRFIANRRTGNFTLQDTFGIASPFGPRSDNSYPFSVKLIEWEDLGMFGLKWWKIRLKFAELHDQYKAFVSDAIAVTEDITMVDWFASDSLVITEHISVSIS